MTLGIIAAASVAPAQVELPPGPPPATEEEQQTALEAALEALSLSADTQAQRVKSVRQRSDPRTIGVYLNVADPELEGQATDLLVEVCLQPFVYMRSISWHERQQRHGPGAPPLREAYEQARDFVAGRFELWDEEHAVLVDSKVWDGVSRIRPIHDVEFAWRIESGGFAIARVSLGLDGNPPLPSRYGASISADAQVAPPKLSALDCIPVVRAVCRAGKWMPGMVHAVGFSPASALPDHHESYWQFGASYMLEAYPGGTGCSMDASTGRLAPSDRLRDDPDVLRAADEALRGRPRSSPPALPPPAAAPGEREAIAAAADFVGVPADAVPAGVEWTEGWGGRPKAALSLELPATQDGPARRAEIEVQSGTPYYVIRAYAPEAPGFVAAEGGMAAQGWALAWDFARAHFRPWSAAIVAEQHRVEHPRGELFWYHIAQDFVRTGSWAVVEVVPHLPEGQAYLYVDRYEARLAPERRIDEMTVDLLDAVATLRKEVEATPGVIFLLDYGVPTLSHPSSPTQNPAWEVRYFVGPGGPEPVIRWGAVDATDGSIIHIDRDKPECCFPDPH